MQPKSISGVGPRQVAWTVWPRLVQSTPLVPPCHAVSGWKHHMAGAAAVSPVQEHRFLRQGRLEQYVNLGTGYSSTPRNPS
jgi:hypothetical protein